MNADGTGLRALVTFTNPQPIGHTPIGDVCWTPDGQQIAYTLRLEQQQTAPSFLVNADGSGEPVEIDVIPDSWHPWYWPQWSH